MDAGQPPAGLPAHGWVMVVDLQRCGQCPAAVDLPCVRACARAHHLPLELRAPTLGRTSAFFPATCTQCVTAPCAGACPVGAVAHDPQGIATVNQELCIGCRFCLDACPTGGLMYVDPYQVEPPAQGVPGYSPAQPTGLLPRTVAKCTFCTGRLRDGELPFCVAECPLGALWVGDVALDRVRSGAGEMTLSQVLQRRRYLLPAARPGAGGRVLQLV